MSIKFYVDVTIRLPSQKHLAGIRGVSFCSGTMCHQLLRCPPVSSVISAHVDEIVDREAFWRVRGK